MDADDYQVAGNHYRGGGYQHWNLVLSCDLDYLAGCSTKYVSRWRKKDGLKDLQKSLHYLNKLEESRAKPLARLMTVEEILREVNAFSEANKLSDLERSYVRMLSTWQTRDELNMARELLFLLLDEAEALEKGAKPVPLCEENHYSERAGEPHVD
jgi:hypothetical protein